MANDQSPFFTNCDLEVTNRVPFTDLPGLEGTYKISKLGNIFRGKMHKALNQCREAGTGVMC